MANRSIRLKEHEPNSDKSYEVADKYRIESNETLGEGPFRVRTDQDGFILTGNEPADGPPVVFLGDSFVESSFASEQARFVSQVERLTGYRCLNGGYSGSTSLHLLNAMVNKVYPLVGIGGKVVFIVGQTDSALDHDKTYWTDHKRGTPVIPSARTSGPVPAGLDSTRRVLKVAIDTAAALGIDLVLGISAFSTPDFGTDRAIRAQYKRNRDAFERIQKKRVEMADAVREVAANEGVPFIDAHAFMGGDTAYFYDELHLNEAGQAHFAQFVATELQKIF